VIFEEQTYTMQVGKAHLLVDAYAAQGLEILERNLGRLVAFWTVDVGGDIDQIIQVWAFHSHEERADCRKQLLADPAWISFAKEYGPLITRREMRVLVGAEFSPIK
jgi:hypothetical protein